ncbi:uncharacterized protein LOC123698719 [Colias croceus]|uniref:uncharacterized protein LOC123698719 n=1 Tax=Colias crocea TaxID=72248 RepID=UPI001E27ECF7|nr:uncharacterized protein LOC123698719 [Colias croceus]
MGSLRIILFVAAISVEVYNVAAQCGRVEYLSQPSSAVATATPMIQPISHCIIPAIIKPFLSCESSSERAPASHDYNQQPNYPPYPPMNYMPPIIYEDDDDDDWHHLLYFLLFAMRNRGNSGGYGSYPAQMPYTFYPVPTGFGYNDNRCGCDDNNSGSTVNYIPYPVPVQTSCGIMDSTQNYGDDITIMQSPAIQALNGRDNEVTLHIRTD